jgi:hypothetical protein
MTPRRVFVAVAAVVLLGLFAWQFRPRETTPDTGTPSAAIHPAAPPLAPTTATFPAPATATRTATVAAAAERSELADTLNSPDTDIHADLRVLDDVFMAYRTNFHSDPVGTNAEITAALTGKNPLHLAVVPRDHPAINGQGELCDRWGRPFFFHQLSGTQMEIRSAGPDRKFWTDDDVVLTP